MKNGVKYRIYKKTSSSIGRIVVGSRNQRWTELDSLELKREPKRRVNIIRGLWGREQGVPRARGVWRNQRVGTVEVAAVVVQSDAAKLAARYRGGARGPRVVDGWAPRENRGLGTFFEGQGRNTPATRKLSFDQRTRVWPYQTANNLISTHCSTMSAAMFRTTRTELDAERDAKTPGIPQPVVLSLVDSNVYLIDEPRPQQGLLVQIHRRNLLAPDTCRTQSLNRRPSH